MNIPNFNEEAERVFRMADLDENGTIEFTEWCTATMDRRKILTKQRIKSVFEFFDKDGSGQISLEEIKQTLGCQNQSEGKIFKDMIRQIDTDGNGEINLKEFEEMMNKLFQP